MWTKVSIGCAVVGLGVWGLRRQIQGYWFDKSCTSDTDVKGRIAVITGGNSGVGFETAVSLATRGANVVIVCRNEERAKVAVEEIRRRSRSSEVTYQLMDASDLSSVVRFAHEYQKSGKPIHMLISNAGIYASGPRPEGDMHEVWKVNYLAPWLLIHQLMPLIKDSASREFPARIISVSSGAHSRATIQWEDPSESKDQYGQSKLAQIMHMKELQRQCDEENVPILAVSCTPGFTNTPLLDKYFSGSWKAKFFGILLQPLVWALSRSPRSGSQVILECCLSRHTRGGAYYSNCYEKPTTGAGGISNSRESWQRLWRMTESQLKQYLSSML